MNNNKKTIPFSPPDISDLEINEVIDTLKSGWITTGPKTKELEKRLANYCKVNKAVCLNSATAAEELNLRILGIGDGDEVIVPAYTYTATASAVVHVGAKVVFVDSQTDSFEMDYNQVEKAITNKTKAIIAVDIGGVVCDYERLFEIVERKKDIFVPSGNYDLGKRIQNKLGRIAVLADAAHSLGASRYGKMTGSIADFTDFSFHAVKNFTTAEGGASMWRTIEGIDDEEIYHQYQLFSLHGQTKDALSKNASGSWEYDIVGPWYKCNMTDIMASIGLAQLKRYPEILEKRRTYIEMYNKMCDTNGLLRLKHFDGKCISSGHLFLVRVPFVTEEQRREIITKMSDEGIACNVHFKPLPMMTAYKEMGWNIKDFPKAYAYYEKLISLPLNTKMTIEDIKYVIERFVKILSTYKNENRNN